MYPRLEDTRSVGRSFPRIPSLQDADPAWWLIYLCENFNFSSHGCPDLFPAVGILGATIMPHSLYLGSALATQDRASVKPVVLPSPSRIRDTGHNRLFRKISALFRPVHSDNSDSDEFASHADRPNNSLPFIKAHLYHGIIDLVVNLLGIAVVVNSL
jgi:metal iron transporter